ncbi:glutathione S-transferase family protein [Xanthobacter sp. TB0136]|uniref:glutathione S-transferase family protein n=1 Tax=Xanthobacter sp. TB0136 TaxID=3459177 RepID=UPI004039AD57
MLLRTSPTSPFVRKVRLAAAVLGIPLELEVADTLDPNDTLRQQNPLGKIPLLITDDGEAVYDSRVIIAYLDQLAGGGQLVPNAPKARIDVLRAEALADGMMDAGVLLLYEGRFRPQEKFEKAWLDHQSAKVERALAYLEAHPLPEHEQINVADISLACALGFFDFRFEGKWREGHPGLVAWQTRFAARCPSFEETAPRL